MYWLMRPAIGWGAWLLLHSIAIPAVYAIGKKCGAKQAKREYRGELEPVEAND